MYSFMGLWGHLFLWYPTVKMLTTFFGSYVSFLCLWEGTSLESSNHI